MRQKFLWVNALLSLVGPICASVITLDQALRIEDSNPSREIQSPIWPPTVTNPDWNHALPSVTASIDHKGSEALRGLEVDLPRRAFVTLLYSNFVAGTRALGQSLRDSGTTADKIVLVTPDVTQEVRRTLAKDGWIVRPVKVEVNPNANFQSRLVFVYTKLLIFNMTEYQRIVFLDSDTLVLDNVDELFLCEPFCAVMRHSELLNSGVLVVTPDARMYEEMHSHFADLDSYTGGDQGFLNSFYASFAACPAFEPYSSGAKLGQGSGHRGQRVLLEHKPSEVGNHRAELGANLAVGEGILDKRCWRLATRYNGDWPLLFVDGDTQAVQGKDVEGAPSDWLLRKRIKILHFTFGTAKPWNWWAYPFLPYVDLWLDSYAKAESGQRGMGETFSRPKLGGVMGQLLRGLTPIAVCGLLWLVQRRWCKLQWGLDKARRIVIRFLIPSQAILPDSLLGNLFNLIIGFSLLIGSVIMAFSAVPNGTIPGPAKPEASWAFFVARGLALTLLMEGIYLSMLFTKAAEAGVGIETHGTDRASSYSLCGLSWGQKVLLRGDEMGTGGEGAAQGSDDGQRCGGFRGPRSSKLPHPLVESLAHFGCLFVFLVYIVVSPLCRGLNGYPASRMVLPGLANLLALLVAMTLSLLRLPKLWAAHGTQCQVFGQLRSNGVLGQLRMGEGREA